MDFSWSDEQTGMRDSIAKFATAELNAGYAELKKDPEAWAEELAEEALWDRTLMDGLEADE